MTYDRYVPVATGLGDILLYYMQGDIGLLADWRRQHPEARTLIVASTVSDQTPELFRYFPDATLDCRTWTRADESKDGSIRAIAPGYERFSDADKAATKQVCPPFYMSQAESVIAGDFLKSVEPYIAIHPFAGDASREFRGKLDTRELIERLANEGHRVVILGGDSNRIGYQNPRPMRESLSGLVAHPGIYNLLNAGTVRLHAHLASRAAGFIGTTSAYNCVAHAAKVPSCVLAATHLRSLIARDDHGIFWMMREQGDKVIYVDELARGRGIPDIVEWARGIPC